MLEYILGGLVVAALCSKKNTGHDEKSERQQIVHTIDTQVEFRTEEERTRYEVKHGHNPKSKVTGRTEYERTYVTYDLD